MRIKRRNSLFIRRGRRIWFYDIVQGPTATTVMTTALRRRRPSRGNTGQYWSHGADSSQDLSLTLANPMQSRNLIYPSLSHRRLTLRRKKSARPRPRKASSATPTRVPNDVLAAYKASCMRKTRRPSPLNVGEMQITSSHIHFTAHYLNSAPSDAQISLPFAGIVHIRRACYRRVLPHGVLIRCEGFPDYLMVLADRTQQAHVLQVLANALRDTQVMEPSVSAPSDRLFEYDSCSSVDRDTSLHRKPFVERKPPIQVGEDFSARTSSGKNESNPTSSVDEQCSCGGKSKPPVPEPDNVKLQTFRTVTFAARTMSQGKQLLSSGPGQIKTLANDLIWKDNGTVDEDLMESTIFLISAVLLLLVTLGVIIEIGSLRSRVLTLSTLFVSPRK